VPIINKPNPDSLSLQKQIAQLIVWSTKAFIMRAHKNAQKMWDIMHSLLQTGNTITTTMPTTTANLSSGNAVAIYTAQQMHVIFMDVRALTNVRSALYKQRYFTMNLPILLDAFRVCVKTFVLLKKSI
jgi:hypothetical protein